MGNWGYLFFTVAYLYNVHGTFLGNIEAKMDAKGRLFIPTQFRRQLNPLPEERLIMHKDVFQDCRILYPGKKVWEDGLNELKPN